jgi:hypothetical protein
MTDGALFIYLFGGLHVTQQKHLDKVNRKCNDDHQTESLCTGN